MPSKYLLFLFLAAVAGAHAAPFAYVSNCCSNPSYTSVISTSTGVQTSLVKTGTGGFASVISPDGSLVYVSNTLSQSITVFQESTLALVKTIPVPGYVVEWMGLSPDGTKLYITSADSQTSARLVGINTSTGAILGTFAPNAPLTPPVVSKDGTEVFVGVQLVTGSVQSGLAVLNSSTLAETLAVNGVYAPGGVAISPDGTKLYVSNLGSSLSPKPQLSVLSESSYGILAVAPMSATQTPGNVSINPSGSIVYACEEGSTPDVVVFSTASNTVTTKLPTGGFEPVQTAASADGTRLYITTAGNSSVLYFNTTLNQEIGTIAVPGSVNGLALSMDGTKLIVPNYGSSQVSVVDEASGKTVAAIPVGDMTNAPGGQVAVNQAGTYVFATNFTSNNLSVISTATHQVVATVPTGPHPIALCVLPNGAKVYVLNAGNNTVTIVDGAAFTALNTVTPLIPSGSVVTSIAMDPGGAKFYVAEFDTKTETKSVIVSLSTVNHETTGSLLVENPIALGTNYKTDELLTLGFQTNTESLFPINLAVKPPVVVTSGIVPLNIPPVSTVVTNGIAVSPSGTVAFATCSGSTFSINLSALTVTVLASSAGVPSSLALDPGGAELWVANSGSLNVSVFAAGNGSPLPSIYLANPSYGIVFAPQ